MLVSIGEKMEERYQKALELICKLEEEVKIAKENLLSGASPYISLQFVELLAQEAKREWHIQKGKA